MNRSSTIRRSAGAVLFALLLSLRLIGATGYMPSFNDGRLALIVCPDADENAPLAIGPAHHHHDHHHGNTQHRHQPCPYASASPFDALGTKFGALVVLLIFAVNLLVGRTFLFVERHRFHDRPPPIGPPLPA